MLGGGVSHPSQLTTGLVIKSVTTSPTLAGERMLFILQVSILSEQTISINPSVACKCAPILPGSWAVISALGKKKKKKLFRKSSVQKTGTPPSFSAISISFHSAGIWNGICFLYQRPSAGTSKAVQHWQKKERKKK